MKTVAVSGEAFETFLMTEEEARAYVKCRSRTSFWRWRKARGIEPRERVGGLRFHKLDLDRAIERTRPYRMRKWKRG